MNLKIAVLSGDGIGPEVTEQAVKVLKAIAINYDHHFSFTPALVGATCFSRSVTWCVLYQIIS
jgi:3-isopropylmalate dehydrogenase